MLFNNPIKRNTIAYLLVQLALGVYLIGVSKVCIARDLTNQTFKKRNLYEMES